MRDLYLKWGLTWNSEIDYLQKCASLSKSSSGKITWKWVITRCVPKKKHYQASQLQSRFLRSGKQSCFCRTHVLKIINNVGRFCPLKLWYLYKTASKKLWGMWSFFTYSQLKTVQRDVLNVSPHQPQQHIPNRSGQGKNTCLDQSTGKQVNGDDTGYYFMDSRTTVCLQIIAFCFYFWLIQYLHFFWNLGLVAFN